MVVTFTMAERIAEFDAALESMQSTEATVKSHLKAKLADVQQVRDSTRKFADENVGESRK
jgi:hypothetical protein